MVGCNIILSGFMLFLLMFHLLQIGCLVFIAARASKLVPLGFTSATQLHAQRLKIIQITSRSRGVDKVLEGQSFTNGYEILIYLILLRHIQFIHCLGASHEAKLSWSETNSPCKLSVDWQLNMFYPGILKTLDTLLLKNL
jgi:hypothetical protein